MTEDVRYQYQILDVCADLHAVATQGDPNGSYLHEVVLKHMWLQERLNTWVWAPERSFYDRLVFRLIEVTCAEVDVHFAQLAKRPMMAGYCDECGGSDCSNLGCELARRAIFLWERSDGIYPGGNQ